MLTRLSRTDYDNIDRAEIGLYSNVAYGTIDNVRSHGIACGAVALLTANLSAAATSFVIDQDDGFPATPFIIQCQEERMTVTDITSLVVTVTRGYDNTEPVAHSKNKTIYEVKTSYIYLLANHPVKSIGNVYIDGSKQVSRYTAYTGQSGDEHPSYSGRAVIEFTGEPYIAPQFNLEYSAEKEQGTELRIRPEIASHHLLIDGLASAFFGTLVIIGPGETASLKFPKGYGHIIKQRYSLAITPVSGSSTDLFFSLSVSEDGILKAYTNDSYLSRFSLTRIGGIWDDVLKISNQGPPIKIGQILKIVQKRNERYGVGSDTNKAIHAPAITIESYAADGQPGFAGYSAVSPITDATIVSQTHYAEITIPGLSTVSRARISAVDPTTNNVFAFKDYYFPEQADTDGEMFVTHAGGGWDAVTKVTLQHDIEVEAYSFYKEVTYTTPEIVGAAAYATSSAARVVVGGAITADAEFAIDTTGDYGGIGSLINRPDWVMKHFLINERGASAGDIDTASFASAGTLYTAASYELNLLVLDSVNEDEMAYECRSVVYMSQGKYYLDVVLDASPASVMTIPQGDVIDAVGFTYDHGKIEDLHTDYTARYGLKTDNTWRGVVTAVDAVSKYGTRIKNINLPYIVDAAQAQSVLNNILLQHQELYGLVRFTVSWKYHTLQIGDTFDVTCDLYNGVKFFVEKIRKNSDNTLYVEGRQWWV